MKDISFTIVNDSGLEVKCDALAVVNDDNNNTYLIYTDYTFNNDDEYKVYVSQMIKEEGFTLKKVENYGLIPGLQEAYDDIVRHLSLKID